jgi:putative DNA primase/helicase
MAKKAKYNYAKGERRGGKIVKEYFYYDEHGELYAKVERTEDHQFPQSTWGVVDKETGKKGWLHRQPKPKKPYNLPLLLAAPPEQPIYICEGEKDADTVEKWGLISTTNPGGAEKWTKELSPHFKGKELVYILEDNDDPGRKHALQVARAMRSVGVKNVHIVALPGLEEKQDVTDWVEKHGGTKKQLLDLCAVAPRYAVPVELDSADAMRSARAMVEKVYTTNGTRTLHRYRSEFWTYTGTHYRGADDEVIKSKIWQFLEAAVKRDKENLHPFKPNKNIVGNVFDALTAVCQLDQSIEAPAWLDGEDHPPADQFLAVSNGLLHLPTRKLYPPTPIYFGFSASRVAFDKKAEKPAQWLAFLNQVLVNPQAIAVVQEWFGYTLSADTSQQKILLCIGPKRSGKGTMARVHTEILGKHSVVGPTMASLSEPFGMEPLIAKPLAIISDARLGARTNKSAIVERLLSISGEDGLTVARKFKLAWTGRLPTRFAILTNEMPSFSDGSGALVSRFVVLLFQHSFYGKEDVGLTNRLLTEVPGILSWAIDGYQRLAKRGYFIQPQNAKDAIEEMEMLGSPVKAFIRDRCDVGPAKSVEVDQLYSSFRKWCESEGMRDPGSKEWFGRNLHTAIPGLKVAKFRADKADRVRVYQGIALDVKDVVDVFVGRAWQGIYGPWPSGSANPCNR